MDSDGQMLPRLSAPLIGRASECAAIGRLTDAARTGVSASLMVTGEPGIGKSSLLAYGVEAAGTGMSVVTARGIRAEADIPFAALAQLLRPLAWNSINLPQPQRTALEAAFAMTDVPVSGIDRFAVGAGVLNVLADVAVECPVLVVVDDMQWIDGPSAGAIIFAARRLEHDRVGFLLAYRDNDVAELPDFPQLRVTGLDSAGIAQLLATHHLQFSQAQVACLARLSGGNPLALVDLPDLMKSESLVELDLGSGPLPLGAVLENAYGERIDRLSEDARRALLVAALIHGADPQVLRTALAAAAVDMSALEAAVDARLVSVDASGVVFRHPLIRSATVQRAACSDRRMAHSWIASALEVDRTVEGRTRRAWHLAAAVYGPDEEVAAGLEASARWAVGVSGYASASSAFERAAQLSVPGERQASRLFSAAMAAFNAGNTRRAADLLRVAREVDTAEDETRVDIEALAGRVDTRRGDPGRAYRRLVSQARLREEKQPELALKLLATASAAAVWAGLGDEALAVAYEAVEIGAATSGPYTVYSRCAPPIVRTLLGEAEGDTTLDDAVARFPLDGDLPPQILPLLGDIAFGYTILDRFEDATAIHRTMIRLATDRAAAGLMVWPVGEQALVEFRTGRWREAEAGGLAAERLANDAGLDNEVANNRQLLAWIAAARGRTDECRRYASQVVEQARRTRLVGLDLLTYGALGLLELGEGRPDDAVVTLEKARHLATVTGFHDAAHFQWAAELVEAYVQCGRLAEAEPLVNMLMEQARRTRRPIVGALALRCRGLVRPEDSFDEDFTGALQLHGQSNRPFETARTELRFGQRLRRRKTRSEARTHLRAAWETFSALGADCWTACAHNELEATGVRLAARAMTGADLLTPQELQIALAVCEGASNRQVAERLFVSAKTVEYHLSHVYRKLDITSRSELGVALPRSSTLSGRAGQRATTRVRP
jgi:DNA-binding CsgD family transcriptional regulator